MADVVPEIIQVMNLGEARQTLHLVLCEATSEIVSSLPWPCLCKANKYFNDNGLKGKEHYT